MMFRPAATAALAALGLMLLPAAASAAECTPRASSPRAELTLVSEKQVDPRTTVYTFRSAAVGSEVTDDGLVRARVIRPVGYDASVGQRYPVLYFLHGAGADGTRIPADIIQGITGDAQVIVVSPDGGSSGWYSDWYGTSDSGPNPPPAWETFHLKELLPWIDATLRTTGMRATAGESMGGFGAMSYPARNPGLFVAAGSFSGAVDTQDGGVAGSAALSTLMDECVWGDPVEQRDNWSAHNPTALAPKLRGVSLFVASGNGAPGRHDETPPDPPESMALEASVYRMSRNFVDALNEAQVPVETWFYGPGTHGWQEPHSNQRYIYDDLARFLPQAMAALGAPRATPAPRVAVRASPRHDRAAPFRFRVRGRISLPDGIRPADGCNGVVTLRATRRGRTVGRRDTKVLEDCSFRQGIAVAGPARGRRTVRLSARFEGNHFLAPATAKSVRRRIGRKASRPVR